MKKTKMQNVNENKSQAAPGLTVVQETGPADIAKAKFLKKVGKRWTETMGENIPEVDKFLSAIERATLNGTFSVYDVIRECKGHELESKEVTELFAKWLSINLSLNRVIEVPSCYDWNVYIRV
jgi:hypothetical protein